MSKVGQRIQYILKVRKVKSLKDKLVVVRYEVIRRGVVFQEKSEGIVADVYDEKFRLDSTLAWHNKIYIKYNRLISIKQL